LIEHFQSATTDGISYRYLPASLATLGMDELRTAIHELNLLSNELGCAVFEGSGRGNSTLVIFAGNLERFSMLSAARRISSRVVYFQDTASWWYGGSSMLPDLGGISSFLNRIIGGDYCVVFGQSSGGYAALAMGGLNAAYDVLACSPQTFPDKNLKQRLHISHSLAVQYTPDNLIDISELYSRRSRSGTAAAIFSASEFCNPYQSHFWLDHLHMAKIAHVQSIDTYIAASANHSIVYQRAETFSLVLNELIGMAGKRADLKRKAVRRFVNDINQNDAQPA